ncbi:SDR family oxidoreductase [Acuticoccus sp. M5D2P5]|uniref:SDR family oxidoreductase n=1 Tax=Acuticoccus kalidii TaxID=2910977 RepID=UPI001F2A7890|nr:SDR family oxidoreductase [Acuticoccus kalidii]MCF3935377.1 SDR family oxidoreductase [Acuticoccus kalidii]
MDLGLSGRTVLITGASQGIGAAAARAFAAEGCHLHLTARSTTNLDAVKVAITAAHDVDVTLHPLDLSVAGAAEALADTVGFVDALVNNAGAIPGGDLWSVDEATWRAAWDLKVHGYINLCRAVYAKMKPEGRGVIINDIGNAGERLDADYICGSTGNAALMAFTRALGGKSLTADGIRVVGVNPGPVDTERMPKLLRKRAKDWFGDENRWEELLERYPLHRMAKVEEIADAMLFLASDRSGYTSGTILTIDGGIVSRNSIV